MEINTTGWSTASILLGSPSLRRLVALLCSGQAHHRGWRGPKNMKPSSGCGKRLCLLEALEKQMRGTWNKHRRQEAAPLGAFLAAEDAPCAGSHWLPMTWRSSPMCNSTVERLSVEGCACHCFLPPLALPAGWYIFHSCMKVGRGVPEGLHTPGMPLLEFIRAEGKAA